MVKPNEIVVPIIKSTIGKIILSRLGNSLSTVLFFLSAISGGLAFYLLNISNNPMIGASGAVFGFIGENVRFWINFECMLARLFL